MQKDILKDFLKGNVLETCFYLECLENSIKKIDDKSFRLKNTEKVLNAVNLNGVTRAEFDEHIKKFLNKSVNGKVRFRDVVQIVYEEGSSYIKVLDNDYFWYPLIEKEYEYDLQDNIKGKILIGLMINFETLFNNMLNYLIPKKIELFFDSKDQGSVLFSEILQNPNKDFKQFVIEKQIEKLSYDVIESIEKLVRKLKLDDFYFKENGDLVKEFYEVYYRRNVIIHNAGKVNQLYLIKTKQTEEDVKIGTKLELTDEYIKHAEDICNDYGCMIYAMFGKILSSEDKKEYYYYLAEYALSQSKLKHWEDSKFNFELLKRFDNSLSAQCYEYNLEILNCKKHLGDKSYLKDVSNMDVSALSGIYKVSKELLLDNYDQVLELLDFYYPKEITNSQILLLPIFDDFRNSTQYKEFVKAHNGEFNMYELTED